jgi:hypothetical protein
MGIRALTVGLAIAASAVFASSGFAANWFEKNFGLSGPRYEADVPLCEDGWVTWKIQARFSEKERTFWNSGAQIVSIDAIRERAFRPGHYAQIPRRFCSGYATISDGSRRPIHYWIGEDTGWLGMGWGVEWCVVGYDRNWAYNPACKMAQP